MVGTEAVTSLTSNREQMSFLALAAVFVWLLVALRSVRRAALVLFPVLTAVALGSAVIVLFGIKVNTLAAISGPLVIATCTEFTVLIMERYLEERRDGQRTTAAVETASTHIGQAFVASGLTTAAGFGVLALSGFPLLSGFGVVVSLNVVVALGLRARDPAAAARLERGAGLRNRARATCLRMLRSGPRKRWSPDEHSIDSL